MLLPRAFEVVVCQVDVVADAFMAEQLVQQRYPGAMTASLSSSITDQDEIRRLFMDWLGDGLSGLSCGCVTNSPRWGIRAAESIPQLGELIAG